MVVYFGHSKVALHDIDLFLAKRFSEARVCKMDLNEDGNVDNSDDDTIQPGEVESGESDTGEEEDDDDNDEVAEISDENEGAEEDVDAVQVEVAEAVRPREQRSAAGSRCGRLPSENSDCCCGGAGDNGVAGGGGSLSGNRGSRLLRTLRRSGRRALAAGPIGRLILEASSSSSSAHEPAWPSIDIVSLTIHCQIWHVTDLVLSYLDAVSVKHCEDVCVLWRNYIRGQNVWRKLTQRAVMRAPMLAKQNGWSRHLPVLGGKEPRTVDEFKQASFLRTILVVNCWMIIN